MIRRKATQEGETYQHIEELKITPDTNAESCLFFLWPLDIVHVIDRYSPFYEMSAADLAKEVFELVLVMEGTNETSNMIFQARKAHRIHILVLTAAFSDLPTCHRRSSGAKGLSS